jgi:hypothetical protein
VYGTNNAPIGDRTPGMTVDFGLAGTLGKQRMNALICARRGSKVAGMGWTGGSVNEARGSPAGGVL